MLSKSFHSLALLFLILTPIILFSCAKKEDWECTCEIHTATSSTTETLLIKGKIRSDADRECTQFGNDKAGPTNAYECNLK